MHCWNVYCDDQYIYATPALTVFCVSAWVCTCFRLFSYNCQPFSLLAKTLLRLAGKAASAHWQKSDCFDASGNFSRFVWIKFEERTQYISAAFNSGLILMAFSYSVFFCSDALKGFVWTCGLFSLTHSKPELKQLYSHSLEAEFSLGLLATSLQPDSIWIYQSQSKFIRLDVCHNRVK